MLPPILTSGETKNPLGSTILTPKPSPSHSQLVAVLAVVGARNDGTGKTGTSPSTDVNDVVVSGVDSGAAFV